MVATGFPGGIPDKCPVCQARIRVEPTMAGDALCPACGTLVWPPPQTNAPDGYKRRSTLGNYTLIRVLGAGGFARTFLARDKSGRFVTIKVLHRELAARPSFVERLLSEARLMVSLDHPGIVKILAVDTFRGLHFIVKEHVEGRTVQDWLDQLGRFSLPDSLCLLRSAAVGLQYLHARNLIHRDIKPDNFWVTNSGHVTIDDFGLAKAVEEDVSMTQSATGLGTPLYMAPEQARSAVHLDQRADIYSLGSMAYHLLTGQLAYQGDSALELIVNKEKGDFPSASTIVSSVPPIIDELLTKMMENEPGDRFASAREVIEAIDATQMAGSRLSFIES